VWAIIATPLFAQEVPQGFSYQAILRDDSGAIIANTEVTVELSLRDAAGSEQWVEKHTVTTNQFGLIALIVGKGARIGGTVSEFKDIDWSSEPLYINNTIIHNSQRIDVGTSGLYSVPYSLVADKAYDLVGEVSRLNVIEDKGGAGEEPLFEVKNNTGQTVFAVYNEGVEVFFDDTNKKGIKGSFAVRGFGSGKAEENNYMILSGDSARIYINNDETDKGIKGSFAVRGFGSGKADEIDYMVLSNDSARIYINNDESAKGIKGSFAVRGFGSGKGNETDYMILSGDSARIYINNDDTDKGIKGSFAVGSFNTGFKSPGEEYLRISRDSSRIYINDTDDGGKGIKGSFAVQGFKDIDKGGGNNYFDINMDETSSIIDPAENRILWYPFSNAFMAGRVLVTDPENVGENSFVVGYESRAKGDYSQAMGYKAYADGENSTSIGENSRAEGDNSYAIGQGAQATAPMSYALGRGAIASGTGSFAFGSAGIDSVGNPTDYVQASGPNSVAIGQGARAWSEGSIAIGVGNSATNRYAVALGYQTYSSGHSSFAAGSKTKATNNYSTALGYTSTASGFASTALGWNTKASLNASFAAGYYTEARNFMTTAMGNYAVASGHSSMAFGNHVTAKSYGETVFGMYNTDYTPASTTYPNPGDRLFVIGNGTYNNPSDALVILKNGNVGIGNPEKNLLNQYSLAIKSTNRGIHITTDASSAYTYPSSIYSTANGGTKSYAFSGTASNASSENYGIRVSSSGSGATNYGVYASASGGSTNYAGFFEGNVHVTGNITANNITSPSDSRLKTNIGNIENPLDKIMSLNGVSYKWNAEEFPERYFDNRTHIGIIAQNIEEVQGLEDLVYTDENGYKSVSYDELIPILIEAVKALKSENEGLKSRIEALESLP